MSEVGRFGTPTNPLTLIGVALTTVGGVLFLLFFFLDLAGFHSNPYLGIVTFLLLPAVLGLGLAASGVTTAPTRRPMGA
jgi:hypothetical protein